MRKRILLAVAPLLLTTACYRVTVITGATPAPQVVDKEWALSFVYGLVPPPVLEMKDTCKQGVAQVVTERSFLNGLVGAITWSIFTPMHTTVTCASGPVAK